MGLEPSLGKRVPLLLRLGEGLQALRCALSAGDVDLACLCLLHAERRRGRERLAAAAAGDAEGERAAEEAFGALVGSLPEARALFLAYYRQRIAAGVGDPAAERRLVLGLLRARGGWAAELEAAEVVVREAYGKGVRPRERARTLREAARLLQQSRENAFSARCTEDQAGLLEAQAELEEATGREGAFVGKSLAETLAELMGGRPGAPLGRADEPGAAAWGLAEARRLAKRFQVPEGRLWTLRVRALAAKGHWEELRRLACGRQRPPCGHRAFARVALQHGRPPEDVFFFAERVQDAEGRFDALASAAAEGVAGAWAKAAEVAAAMRDAGRLRAVAASCKDPALQAALAEQLAKLG